MPASPAPSLLRLDLTRPLAVRLYEDPAAPMLAHEPVRIADLAAVASEAWRDGCLRAGHPEVPLAEAPMRLAPILADGSATRCAGLELELALPDGKTTRHVFSFNALRHVADRAAALLFEAGVLRAGQCYTFDVVLDPQGEAPGRPPHSSASLSVSLRRPALTFLRVSLPALRERATPVALPDAGAFPVFFSQAAFAAAEACARRGGQCDPPVETGGVLFGSLAACAESGEFCALVTDVIEVQDAVEQQFSLSYSSQSWMRLQAIQQARQAAYPQRADRLLGQCHGHSFMPHDGKVCAECAKRPTCSLTSAFVSLADQAWHRAVFARQPWALCLIFGLTARGEPVHQLFGLRDGRLQARGFYLLPDFPFV